MIDVKSLELIDESAVQDALCFPWWNVDWLKFSTLFSHEENGLFFYIDRPNALCLSQEKCHHYFGVWSS